MRRLFFGGWLLLTGCFAKDHVPSDGEALRRQREDLEMRDLPYLRLFGRPDEKEPAEKKTEAPRAGTDCQEIIRSIAVAGAACTIELWTVGKDGKECTEATCPECARLETLRALASEKKC